MTAGDESALRVVEIENQISVQRYLEDSLGDVCSCLGRAFLRKLKSQIFSGLAGTDLKRSYG